MWTVVRDIVSPIVDELLHTESGADPVTNDKKGSAEESTSGVVEREAEAR